MPIVGKTNFGNKKSGMNKARKYAKKTGLNINVGGKEKYVGSSSVKRLKKNKSKANKKRYRG